MKTALDLLLAAALWAQNSETALLGGPCESGMSPPVWHGLVSQQLAEQLAATARPQAAVDALQALYDRRSNQVDLRLHAADSPLKALPDTEAYRNSSLAARLASVSRPPEAYVAKGACPFEGCVYRARKGQSVDARTGEVHLRPIPALVRNPSPYGFTAPEGSIVHLLDYQGGGFGHVWIDGQIVSAGQYGVQEHCTFPRALCWGEYVFLDDAAIQFNGV